MRGVAKGGQQTAMKAQFANRVNQQHHPPLHTMQDELIMCEQKNTFFHYVPVPTQLTMMVS
jgi:hypothetical protein